MSIHFPRITIRYVPKRAIMIRSQTHTLSRHKESNLIHVKMSRGSSVLYWVKVKHTDMTWKLPLQYILYIYTYNVFCITLNKLYLVGCIRGLYHKWIMKQQWFHLSIRASPAYIWCMSCNTAMETHFMPINDIRAQYVCLNTDPGIDTWGMYLCLGNGKWEKSLFGN